MTGTVLDLGRLVRWRCSSTRSGRCARSAAARVRRPGWWSPRWAFGTWRRPRPLVVRRRWIRVAGAGLDVAHAATTVVLAASDRRWRAADTLDAGIAGSLAAASAWSAGAAGGHAVR